MAASTTQVRSHSRTAQSPTTRPQRRRHLHDGRWRLTAVNITIAYKRSGGGIECHGGTVTLDNTIVALNTTASDITGSPTVSGSYNLIGIGGSGGLTNGVNGNQVGVANPGLAPGLANNGGPTQTIALLAGQSRHPDGEIEHLRRDRPHQRTSAGPCGIPNDLNGGTTVDMGAYELSSTYLVTTPIDSFGVGTLRSAIAWANSNPSNPPNPVTNTIIFSTRLSSRSTRRRPSRCPQHSARSN